MISVSRVKIFTTFNQITKFMNRILILMLLSLAVVSCKEESKADESPSGTEMNSAQEADRASSQEDAALIPELLYTNHGTIVMEWGDEVIYVDPVGGMGAFEEQPKPTLILITDIHGDHFNKETLDAVRGDAEVLMPQAVADKITDEMRMQIVKNGQKVKASNISVKGIPMYNTTKDRLQYHTPGRGNGYVLEQDGYRIYISGDTEDIEEMRNLNNIDLAFVCMNLPYTMTPEAAADAVLDFKPKKAIPYHYRGQDGLSDIEEFKSIVSKNNENIEVELMDWYPDREV